MIKAIFYARFHPEKGAVPAPLFKVLSAPLSSPVIAHQVPASSITSPSSSTTPTLLDFPLLSPYLLPPQALCNQLLTLRSPTSPHLILSHPVCIVDPARYDRNEFIFNLGVVLHERDAEEKDGVVEAWKGVVRKVAGVLRGLEVDGDVLSRDEETGELQLGGEQDSARDGSRVYALCEMIREDLNAYGECMIPIDAIQTLSLRLNPPFPPAPTIKPHHVPTLLLPAPTAPNSIHLPPSTTDVTLTALLPHINSINPIFRIAELADADVDVACEAVAALVENGVAVLEDVFSFGACYAVAEGFWALLADEAVLEEGRAYVALPASYYRAVDESESESEDGDDDGQWENERTLSKDGFVRLLASFKQGVQLRQWILEHHESLGGVDVRRLVQFATLKRFLYRVHKYAIAPAALQIPSSTSLSANFKRRRILSDKGTNGEATETEHPRSKEELFQHLHPYLDGRHCFDEICADLRVSDQDIMAALKGQDIMVVYR